MSSNELNDLRKRMDEDFQTVTTMMTAMRDHNEARFDSIDEALRRVREELTGMRADQARFETTLFQWMGSVKGTVDWLVSAAERTEAELERLRDIPERVAELERKLAG